MSEGQLNDFKMLVSHGLRITRSEKLKLCSEKDGAADPTDESAP